MKARSNCIQIVTCLLGAIILLFTVQSSNLWANPGSVTIAGSLQDELGCPGDWQPDCFVTHLDYDAGDDVWQKVFSVPAGGWEYKAALNNSWDENYGANAQRDGPNILLDLSSSTGITDVKFYYDDKSHWVTDDFNSVIATVPGSFQGELGCPGDWQPDCLRSWLQDPDGDGIYTFSTSALPPGSYECKVAINESWDENYGTGGIPDGPNIPFTVAAQGDSINFSYDPVSHILTLDIIPVDDASLVRPIVQHPFQDEVLYFLIPDRFNNAEKKNDCGDYEGKCVEEDIQENVLLHGFLPSDKGYYHGGDIHGLSNKLSYLENLGVTAIWIGPIFKNMTVQPDSSGLYGYSSGYHGYWILDFLQVDPHLGSGLEFGKLVDSAHAKGIKVFMDIVTNHTADVIQLEGNAGYRDKTAFPYVDVSGQPFNDADFAYFGQPDYSFPTVSIDTFPYMPLVPGDQMNAKYPSWLNDPLLYHNRGDSTFNGESSLYGDFFGLDDLWTERKEVVDGMTDIYRFWIEEFGVDGFRIDSAKHVNMEFWQKFGPDILEAAGAAGIEDFFAFGEVFDQQFGPSFLSEFSTRGQLQSTLDFAFQLAARDFASAGGPTDNLRAFFANDDYYTDADSNAYIQPTFLGNHDMGRIGFFLTQDNPGATDGEMLARSKLAHALMFFSRGQPVIYYGDEQGFVGDGGDKDARQDMDRSRVATYNDDDLIGTDRTTADTNFDRNHPLYLALQWDASVYKRFNALRRGAQIHRYSTSGPGIYAFSRIERTKKVEFILAFNNSESPGMATVPTFYPEGHRFRIIPGPFNEGYPGTPRELFTNANGDIDLSVPGLDFVIYKADEQISESLTAPEISISNLQNGQTVDLGIHSMDGHEIIDRLEVEAVLDRDMYAEVTFAVSVNGGEYVPIGTDDNPPYRVFYDVSQFRDEAGVTLDFRAVVNDLSGHIRGTGVAGIVPNIFEPPPEVSGYAVIHYFRDDGDYGDHTTGNFNDFWGLHLWGDIAETIDWTAPKPFLGEDDYGRFAWVKLMTNATNIGFIVHRGDVKDGTNADRFFDPGQTPEIWLRQDDGTTYTSQSEAQGFVTIHYHRDDGDYGDPTSTDFNDFWGVHLWGNGLAPGVATVWTAPRKLDGMDNYSIFWQVPISDASEPVNFIIHRGDIKDPGPDQSFDPLNTAGVWINSGDETIYQQRGAAEGVATIHYHRADGDYGDPASTDFNDFWGMHVWTGAAQPNPAWQDPVRWDSLDQFGPVFKVPLVDGAAELAYIIHRGDVKDPGPDQFLNFVTWGYEVWQLEGEAPDPQHPHYVLPVP
jgi:glycosidase